MMARETQSMPTMWGNIEKNEDMDDPVSFTDQGYLGCRQRTAQVNKRIVMQKQKRFSKLIIQKQM